MARKLGLPRRLLTILEGESLFNDATALVLYAAAVTAATTGQFSVAHTAGSIVYSIVVGVGIGLVVGFVGRWLRNRIDDPPIEIAGSILLAYVAYLPAEEAHASGVLAAVTAGLYLGWHSSSGAFSARSRLVGRVLGNARVPRQRRLVRHVGARVPHLQSGGRGPLGRLVVTALVVVLTVIVVRLVWMWAFGWVGHRADGSHTHRGRWRERLILGWSGMRGAITLAALLAVPRTSSSGNPLAGRNDIIYLGFAVIIATLVGQGMTLPALVRRLRLAENPSVADAERRARIALAQAALAQIGSACEARQLPQEVSDGLRAQYLGRLYRLQTSPDDEDLDSEVAAVAQAS